MHQQLFIRRYGSENHIPKMYMMIHLPEQIKHGPTRNHWTKAYGSRKCHSQKYFNFKNLSLSESEYFQMHFATISWDREAKVKK